MLRDVQQAFVGSVAGALPPAELDRLIRHIADDEVGAQARLAVYANTVRINRQNALRATYPVVERLVGEDFFNYAAETFSRSYPSQSGNLDGAVASALAVEPRFDAAQSLYRRFGDGTVAVPFSLFPQIPWRWMAAGALPE